PRPHPENPAENQRGRHVDHRDPGQEYSDENKFEDKKDPREHPCVSFRVCCDGQVVTGHQMLGGPSSTSSAPCSMAQPRASYARSAARKAAMLWRFLRTTRW